MRLAEGWDNTAFLTADDVVFRFPRRPAAAALLRTEARVLPQLAGRLPLAVPHPLWVGEPAHDFPWPFLGHVHGDLYARHLLTDDEASPTGVIDWGDVHAGDPAVDLMVAFEFLPAGARAAFFEAYGEADADVLRTARLRATFHAISVTWYGVEQADAALVREGRASLEFVLED